MKLRRFRDSTLAAGLSAAIFTFAAAIFAQSQKAAATQSDKTTRIPPAWAYPVYPPGAPIPQPPKDDGALQHVPGSRLAFTLTQIRDGFNAPDWYPNDHPPMPDIVKHGKKPGVLACGFCHLANGQGRPENSSLAGLKAEYIAQQMADFKSGARKSSEPRMGSTGNMIAVAKSASGAEVKAAADYFSGIALKPWIRVVESKTAPRTRVAGSMLVPSEAGGREPLGMRIIEVPQNPGRSVLRDSASGYVAYVPVGSIKEGEALVTTGGAGKTARCATCHGADLRGSTNAPTIIGRSPSYIVRQLYDIQSGARAGIFSQLMKDAVAKLSVDDMVSIAAYLSSRTP